MLASQNLKQSRLELEEGVYLLVLHWAARGPHHHITMKLAQFPRSVQVPRDKIIQATWQHVTLTGYRLSWLRRRMSVLLLSLSGPCEWAILTYYLATGIISPVIVDYLPRTTLDLGPTTDAKNM